MADAFAFVKTSPPPCIANQDWANIPSVFTVGHRGHSNWKTRLQMLFPLPKLMANKCSFCQKGKKKVKPSGKALSLVLVSDSLCGPKISFFLLVLLSQDGWGMIILLLIQFYSWADIKVSKSRIYFGCLDYNAPHYSYPHVCWPRGNQQGNPTTPIASLPGFQNNEI